MGDPIASNVKRWLIGLTTAVLLIPIGTAAALWGTPSEDLPVTKAETVQPTQTGNIGCAGFLGEDGGGVCDRCNGAVCSSQPFCAPRKEEHHGGHHNGGHP